MKKLVMIGLAVFLLVGVLFIDSADLFATKSFGESGDVEDSNIVSVQGNGEIKVAPDVAYIQIGVETRDKNAQKAQEENKAIMDKVTNEIKKFLEDGTDIQTSQYSIYRSYDYNDENKDEYYVVNNSLSVTLKNIDNLGKVIDAASTAGSNKISNINFGVQDEQKYYNLALKNAMESAKVKAETIMTTFGKKPGIPKKVTETGSYGGVLRSNVAFDEVMLKSNSVTPIEAGEITITANVTVEYDY